MRASRSMRHTIPLRTSPPANTPARLRASGHRVTATVSQGFDARKKMPACVGGEPNTPAGYRGSGGERQVPHARRNTSIAAVLFEAVAHPDGEPLRPPENSRSGENCAQLSCIMKREL